MPSQPLNPPTPFVKQDVNGSTVIESSCLSCQLTSYQFYSKITRSLPLYVRYDIKQFHSFNFNSKNRVVRTSCRSMYLTYFLGFGAGGRGTLIYGLYRYVPRDRVWFLRFSVLTEIGYHFCSFWHFVPAVILG